MKLAKLGLLIAYPAFALTFRGPRDRFWDRMTTTGAILGTLAIAGDRSLQRPRLRPRDVALGLGIAAGLYGIFQVGDRMARKVLPSGDENIGDIYELRELRPKDEIAAPPRCRHRARRGAVLARSASSVRSRVAGAGRPPQSQRPSPTGELTW